MYNKDWYDINKDRVAEQRAEKRNKPASISVCCRLCDRTVGVKGLALHLRLHAMTFAEYVNQYFDDFVAFGYERCHWCKTGIARKFECQNKERSFCNKVCAAAWKRDHYKGRECTNKGYRWTDAQKYAHSKLLRGRPGIPTSDVTKQKLSIAAKAYANKPDYVNPMQGKTHTDDAIRKIFAKKSFTSLERRVAEILQTNDIVYTSQYFLSRNGECYSYDFHLTGTNILIEADGDYWHGGPGVTTHHKDVEITKATDVRKTAFAKQHGFHVIRVWESEMKKTPDILLERLSV